MLEKTEGRVDEKIQLNTWVLWQIEQSYLAGLVK